MREILFKAKRIDNGEWIYWNIYGELCRKSGKRARLSIKKGATISYYGYIHQLYELIDINTICQFTGLKDKNRNRIWENDIIQYKEIHSLGTVEYIEDSFCLIEVNDGQQYIEGMWNKFEVIGNIFDNPELLKE